MSRLFGILLLVLAGCAKHFPMPMTAAQLADEQSGSALVAYLGQRDANPAVCDLGARGPHLRAVNADVRDALVDGLREDRIAPALWHECVDRMVASIDRESATSVFNAVARTYDRALRDGLPERSPIVDGQLSVMHAVLLNRTADLAPQPDVMTELLDHLHDAIASQQLGAVGLRYGTELIADVELERGVSGGQPVDIPMLDGLFHEGDEAALRRYAVRLPDARLRAEAQRRVIRLHIQRSHYPEVLQNAAAIEETMMRAGANPVSITEHRPLRAWIDSGALVARGALVRQDPRRRTGTLLGYANDGGGISVLPQLSLRGALQVALDGISRPLTLCAPPAELDPSPCLLAGEVRLDSRLVYFDPTGTLRFVEQLTESETAALADSARRLVIPLMVDGQRFTAIEWDLQFETPEEFVFDGGGRYGGGPDINVRVQTLASGRLRYAVRVDDREYPAIVERVQAGAFRVISRGTSGRNGSDGSSGHDGMDGSAGADASCPSTAGTNGSRGQDGSAGDNGAQGEPGGPGGHIQVDVTWRSGESSELLELIRRGMLSQGGAGGSGGAGGRGGRGGAGGSGGQGTTCTASNGSVSYLSGGTSGSRGSDGTAGVSGMAGSDGQPGTIDVRVVE